jgi:hypothetical protein
MPGDGNIFMSLDRVTVEAHFLESVPFCQDAWLVAFHGWEERGDSASLPHYTPDLQLPDAP